MHKTFGLTSASGSLLDSGFLALYPLLELLIFGALSFVFFKDLFR